MNDKKVIYDAILRRRKSSSSTAEGVVLYTEQELTEAQQMQARKNQGLYYDEKSTERIVFDNTGTYIPMDRTMAYDGGFYKVSDTPLDVDTIIGEKFSYKNYEGESEEIIIEQGMISQAMSAYGIYLSESQEGFAFIIVVTDDYAHISELGSISNGKGVYFYDSGDGSPQHIEWLDYAETTTHTVPAKYLPEMPSGGDIFEVEIDGSAYPFTMDKTYAEILAALGAGKTVLGKDVNGNVYLPVNLSGDTIIYFVSTRINDIAAYTINSEDTVALSNIFNYPSWIQTTILEGGVNYTLQGNVIRIDTTTDALLNSWNFSISGKPISGKTWDLIKISGDATLTTNDQGELFGMSVSLAAASAGITMATLRCRGNVVSTAFGTLADEVSALLIFNVSAPSNP